MAANVQLILARDVPNLGRIGDLVKVKAGYARNFLVPQGLAHQASPKHVALFEHQKRVVEHQRSKLRAASEEKAKSLGDLQIALTAKVGEQGKLFGSISSRDIAKAMAAEGHIIDHRDIGMDGPLKSIGLHTLKLRLEADVSAQINVMIAPEEIVEEEVEENPEAELVGPDGEPNLEAEEDVIAAAEPDAVTEVPAEA